MAPATSSSRSPTWPRRRSATSPRSTSAPTRCEPEVPVAVEGPFIDDGTLVKPIAVDTTVPDGSALVKTYTVKPGDNLVAIAAKFHVSTMSVAWANDLKSKTDIHTGQKLSIPPVTGLIVTVTPTDTLDSLAARYGVNGTDILATNGLDDPNLVVGQVLVVPGAKGAPMPTQKPVDQAVPPRGRRRPTAARPPTTYRGGTFLWPVVGGGNYISQYFHYGHYAIDIAADYGSKVRAAAAGTVTFAGWKNNGGGYQVWIAHGSDLYTTYNHMSAISVGLGQHVGRGQQVGRVGQSGNATGPHLSLRGLGRPSLGRRTKGQSRSATCSGSHIGVARDGAGARWRLRSSLTHPEVRSLRCSDAAFAGTVRRDNSRSSAGRDLGSASAAHCGPPIPRRPGGGPCENGGDVPRPREDLGPRRRWW